MKEVGGWSGGKGGLADLEAPLWTTTCQRSSWKTLAMNPTTFILLLLSHHSPIHVIADSVEPPRGGGGRGERELYIDLIPV